MASRHGVKMGASMTTAPRTTVFAALVLLLLAAPRPSWPQGKDAESESRALARAILEELVGIKTTESGVGSTPAAEAVAARLRAAGFSEDAVLVAGAAPRKKNVVARLAGRGKGRPILV